MPAQKLASAFCGKFLPIVFCLSTPLMGMAQRVETYKGNKITFSSPKPDTIVVTDPVSGDQTMKIRVKEAEPLAINGSKIHFEEGIPPQNSIENGSLEDYVLKNLSKELKALPNGEYGLSLKQIIVDEKGKIVYYSFKGVEKQDFEHFGELMSADSVKGIKERIDVLLSNAPAMKPSTIKGKVVVAMLSAEFLKITITVRNHQAFFYKP